MDPSKNKIFDAMLVLECQAGNRKAMSLLVNRWHTKFCKQAFWYTKDMDLAKDIAQDSWGVILKKIPFLRDPNSFGGWAMKIVNRKSIDWIRKQMKERDQLETNYDTLTKTADNNGAMDSLDLEHLVDKSIKDLPDKQQHILQLFYLEEFSIQQISEILGISSGTVKSRLFTAREKLKTILKNRNHEK